MVVNDKNNLTHTPTDALIENDYDTWNQQRSNLDNSQIRIGGLGATHMKRTTIVQLKR